MYKSHTGGRKRTSSPNCDRVVGIDTGIDDTVPGCGEDIGKIQSLLIWDTVWKLEEIYVSIWNPSVLRLSSSLNVM